MLASMWSNRNSYTAGGNENWYSHMEENVAVSHKIKHALTIISSIHAS